ncbi:hypothetical protein OUZ56_016526 [Daphnia magna]|uniref:Uncharacterized protein n=1 Tax=Daphnia magna TaxID=35525 RepID=A0ABR0AQT1_9CRUS|nr:hypothetical protein OUZ56_016526 [Daphnia magna]
MAFACASLPKILTLELQPSSALMTGLNSTTMPLRVAKAFRNLSCCSSVSKLTCSSRSGFSIWGRKASKVEESSMIKCQTVVVHGPDAPLLLPEMEVGISLGYGCARKVPEGQGVDARRLRFEQDFVEDLAGLRIPVWKQLDDVGLLRDRPGRPSRQEIFSWVPLWQVAVCEWRLAKEAAH